MRLTGALDIARGVFNNEIKALQSVRDTLDETFDLILAALLECKGKVIVTGMGKSGHVGRKIAATLSSLGTCAISVHPAEMLHGDLGMVQAKDIVIAISYSGESDEIIKIIPGINTIGAKLISITGNAVSTLARNSFLAQTFPKITEACAMGLAPTSSMAATLVYGDALAVAASVCKGFGKNEYKVFHPGGALGKSLTLRVSDCMRRANVSPHLTKDSTLADALRALCETQWEMLPVINKEGVLAGEIHADEINRMLSEGFSVYETGIKKWVKRNLVFINVDEMAVEALRMMERNGMKTVFVVKDDRVAGLLRTEDILQQGVFV